MKSLIKNKRLAWIGLVWLILVIGYSIYSSGTICESRDPDCNNSLTSHLLELNIYLLPSWILFLCSLDLSKKNRWRYKK